LATTTSEKAKRVWAPEQINSIKDIRNTIAQHNYTTMEKELLSIVGISNTINIFFLEETAHFIMITKILDFKTSSQNESVVGVRLWGNFNISLYIAQDKTIS
jgi:hypothetical protein